MNWLLKQGPTTVSWQFANLPSGPNRLYPNPIKNQDFTLTSQFCNDIATEELKWNMKTHFYIFNAHILQKEMRQDTMQILKFVTSSEREQVTKAESLQGSLDEKTQIL